MAATHPPPKPCQTCGRTIGWRKKWERDWDNVRYCSGGCRSHKADATDTTLEAAILRLLQQRGRDKTICPSEAARAVAGEDEAAWRPLMERARMAARRLSIQGKLKITQSGKDVTGTEWRGPIRLRLP